MTEFLSKYLKPSANAVKFTQGTNISFESSPITITGQTEIFKYSLNEYSSANISVIAECGSLREILKLLVAGSNESAKMSVYGRTNNGVNILTVTAEIKGSSVIIYASSIITNLQKLRVKTYATFSQKFSSLSEYAISELSVSIPNGVSQGFYIENMQRQSLKFVRGVVYRFNQTAASNTGYPLLLSTTSPTETAFNTHVEWYINNSIVSKAQYLEQFDTATVRYFQVRIDETVLQTPATLYYYSPSYSSMGSNIEVTIGGTVTTLGLPSTNEITNVEISKVPFVSESGLKINDTVFDPTGDIDVDNVLSEQITSNEITTNNLTVNRQTITVNNNNSTSDINVVFKRPTGNKTIKHTVVDGFTLNDNLNITTGTALNFNGDLLLSSTTLGNSVTNSSLTSVGVLSELTVQGNVLIESTSGSINGVEIGQLDPKNGTFLEVSTPTLTSTGNTTISPSGNLNFEVSTAFNIEFETSADGAVVLSPTGTIEVNPAVSGTIDNVNIGLTTPLSANFTNVTITTQPILSTHATTKNYVDVKATALAIALGA